MDDNNTLEEENSKIQGDEQQDEVGQEEEKDMAMQEEPEENQADEQRQLETSKFDPHSTGNYANDPNFFPRIGGMFSENDVLPGINAQSLPNFPFNEGNGGNQMFNMNFGSNFQDVQSEGNFDYGVVGGDQNMMRANQVYQEVDPMMQNHYITPNTPDQKLFPASLSLEQQQKELVSRNLPFSENDKVTNIARLVNYLVDRNLGESDLSSPEEDEGEFSLHESMSRRTYNFLEVILINCDNQRKPLLDWLETWKNASKEVNSVEISELTDNNLIKIRIFNKYTEPSGVIDQLNSVKIKCARYFCYSRGENWGGWEYYEDGFMQKSETYNNEHQPPLFWKRLCWLENVDLGSKKMDKSPLSPDMVCAILGTDEEMICVDCGNTLKTCANVHGSFNGHFKSKDLYNRYSSLSGAVGATFESQQSQGLPEGEE